MSRKGKKQERSAKPYVAWMLRHELLSSCGLTLVLGLVFGGVTTVLEWMLL